MKRLAREVRDHAARFGAGRGARYLAWRLADRFAGYVPYRGLVLPASRVRDHGALAPEGIVCREVALDELAPYTGDPAYDLSARFVSEARARGDCCIGVFARQTLASFSFNSRVPTNIDAQFRYEFPEGWVYHFKAFTHPQWRGQRLHGRQIAAVLQKYAGAAGFKGLTTLVVMTNYPSLASFARLAFEPAFRFTILGKGPARRVVAERRGGVLERSGKAVLCGRVNGEPFYVAKLGV